MANDRSAPATRDDLADFKAEFSARFESFEHRLDQLLSEMESRMMTATYRLAESIQHRLTQAEATEAALNARLAVLEERLTELEKRLNIAPQQVQ